MRRKDDGSGWLVTRGELDLECGELLYTLLTAELAVDEAGPFGHRGLRCGPRRGLGRRAGLAR